jgi:hypothetical protein
MLQNMTKFGSIVLLILFIHFGAITATAAEIRAFHNYNLLPFKQIFGLPSLDNSPLQEAGRYRVGLIYNISNTYNTRTKVNEQIATDVETSRASLVAYYALTDNWQFGVEVPYVEHDGGFLDDFIYDWHDFFRMPQNNRNKNNSDQIRISYLNNEGASFDISESKSGLGDIRLNALYTKPWNNRNLIFSTELKLPTGDYDKLTGSGSADISVGLTINDPYSLAKYKITFYGGLAGVFLGDIDGEISVLQNNFALVGRAGVGWQAAKVIQLKLQLDAQSALYDSDIKELGDPTLQLLMGGSLVFTDDVYLDIFVAEDINTTTAPDIAFQLALVATF